MPKLPKYQVYFRPDGFADIYSPKSQEFINRVKQYPGRQWNRTLTCWTVPREVVPLIFSDIDEVVQYVNGVRGLPTPKTDSRLYEFQRDAVFAAAANNYTHMLNFEMGLGKTPTAIQALNNSKPQRALIVSPAIMRDVWQDELVKWGVDLPPVSVVSSGKGAIPSQGIVVTSYGLLSHFTNEPFDFTIFDESHYLKNARAARTKHAKALRRLTPNAPCLLLTATPITSEPKDLHAQLDILCPDRFGSYWQFVNRYCNVVKHKYGHDISGVNVLFEEELNTRLQAVTSRVTKHEVAHLLPPFTVQTVPVKSARRYSTDLLDSFAHLNAQQRAGAFDQHSEALFEDKKSAILDLYRDLQADHICIMTHLRSTARELGSAITDRQVFVIDGSVSPSQRNVIIREAKTCRSSVLICTMHSVGIGIDLTDFTAAIFAELYWQPAAVIQTLGRFSRLSGKLPSQVYIPVMKGSIDEPIMHTLRRRLNDQSKLFESGLSEHKMLDSMKQDEASLLDELRTAALQPAVW